jgi:hypothetical protein
MIHAGLKKDAMGQYNNGKLAAGFLITAGWLSTFVLDKPRGEHVLDPEKPANQTIAQKMADDPRGLVARPMAIGNNLANLWGSLNPKDGERKRFQDEVKNAKSALDLNDTPENRTQLAYTENKKNDFIWNVISSCAFLIGHLLFGLSGSKRPADTEDDKSMMKDLILLSANVLAKQPEQLRKAAVSETAEYYSKLETVKLTKQEVEVAIENKISELTHSKWANRVQASASQEIKI